jgi:hypothetical protein
MSADESVNLVHLEENITEGESRVESETLNTQENNEIPKRGISTAVFGFFKEKKEESRAWNQDPQGKAQEKVDELVISLHDAVAKGERFATYTDRQLRRKGKYNEENRIIVDQQSAERWRNERRFVTPIILADWAMTYSPGWASVSAALLSAHSSNPNNPIINAGLWLSLYGTSGVVTEGASGVVLASYFMSKYLIKDNLMNPDFYKKNVKEMAVGLSKDLWKVARYSLLANIPYVSFLSSYIAVDEAVGPAVSWATYNKLKETFVPKLQKIGNWLMKAYI